MARISSRMAGSIPAVMACFALGALLPAVPGGWGGIGPAAAQQRVSVAADFRGALEPHGAWHHNRRFGDVWVPANRRQNWRPYTLGHWVYTETYGWYWVEDVEEADWGWITYHYGRWYLDPDDGWIWIMGDEWSPGWVDWRYGEQVIGWAPLAPAEVAVEVEERPEFWVFARGPDFMAPRLDRVLLPPLEARNDFQRTALVNRPVELRDRHFAVNPGIAVALAAAAVGRPLQAFNVRPRVLAGTANVPGAIQIRAEDLRRQRELSNNPDDPVPASVRSKQSSSRPGRSSVRLRADRCRRRHRWPAASPGVSEIRRRAPHGDRLHRRPRGAHRRNLPCSRPNNPTAAAERKPPGRCVARQPAAECAAPRRATRCAEPTGGSSPARGGHPGAAGHSPRCGGASHRRAAGDSTAASPVRTGAAIVRPRPD